MAFCTNCGAQVTGAFCNQCGTPVAGAAGRAQASAPPQMSPANMTQPPPMPMPAGPVPRKTSPLVWILVAVLGLFVLGFIGVVGTGFFLVHKARQAGIDPDLMRRNPGLAVGKLIAAANPDAEVVSTNDAAGTITVRDKKTGKVVTMTFDQAKSGGLKFSAQDENGQTANIEIGGDANKLPSWIPAYPGSSGQGTFSIRGNANDGSGEGGNFTFTTKDPASKVMSFYQDKAKDLGMKADLTTTADKGGMIVASDPDGTRSLTVVVGESSGETTVNVTYGRKK
jgi:hypothetical protein